MSEATPEPEVEETETPEEEKFVVLRFGFKEIIEQEGDPEDPDSEDWRHIDLETINLVDTNMTEGQREIIGERWTQSDEYWTETTHDIIQAIAEPKEDTDQ